MRKVYHDTQAGRAGRARRMAPAQMLDKCAIVN